MSDQHAEIGRCRHRARLAAQRRYESRRQEAKAAAAVELEEENVA